MRVFAQPVASVNFQHGGLLITGLALEERGVHRLALIRNEGILAVHDLEGLFSGVTAPQVSFRSPWSSWRRGVNSVSPDLSFAVFSGQRAICAVEPDGGVRWQYNHECWGHREHDHAIADHVCGGLESGSVRVSDDGTLVWGHVRGSEYEEWLVLDAITGRVVGRTPLDSVAAGSVHIAHPDGKHVGLSIGLGQDGSMLYWARWEKGNLHSWDMNDDDRILVDVHPSGTKFLTLDHNCGDLSVHAFPSGAAMATVGDSTIPPLQPEDGDEDYENEDPAYWDYYCGHIDSTSVIASTTEADEEHGEGRHWLLDSVTLEVRGQVGYPCPIEGPARPLGDGTWLTHDADSGQLTRWAVSAQ
ncbi:hypothetical protein [Streptomyces panaciradicis]|uniref:hypothetical protein n=1 Tax=Streptomyces panaciradicis TaxID=1470261 RepID=UPI00201CBBF7|nr:hypothetical protein [Streptomyces panaciradicis]MCL6668235.1 hypothetical protein [Streptomyces panaciradicis]